jgi:hypothetical protein
MSVVAVLNDLSYPDLTDGPLDPRATFDAMNEFIDTLRRLRGRRRDVTPLSDEPLPSLLKRLAPSWYADDRNRDARTFLKQLAGRSPYPGAMTPGNWSAAPLRSGRRVRF